MTVLYEMKSEHVALITLNRPDQLNAFNGEKRRDFLDAVARAASEPAVRVFVVTGAGRGFSAGADVTEAKALGRVEVTLNAEYGAFLGLIADCDKPAIAAVNGPAAGVGLSLALTCDLLVMAENAYLMSAFANIGLVPDGGASFLLPQKLGYQRAYQLAIEAEKIEARRCLDWGVANRLAPPGEALAEAHGWAESIAKRAPLAVGLTKRAMRRASQEGLKNAM
ncbi:MAG: enoyl-CoA hydratase/isomerase family protein, partial [Amphiplicatus sp.]